jgi:GTP cyclohydrolase II
VKIVSFPARPAISGRVRRLGDESESRNDDSTTPDALEALARRLQKPAEISLDGRIVVEARTELPTEHGTFDVRLFHFAGGTEEHLAISVGDLSGDEPLPVRIHSECFTGEVLSSLRCECANQLAFALQTFHGMGRGLVIYLRQEGRGIGLANKLKAYALQAKGADTVDANRLLGLPDDARQYDSAAALLRHLDVKSVRLMTNNPSKVRALEQLGVSVADRMPILVASNPIAASYLQTKRDRMEHEVPAQLTLAAPVRR